MSKKKQRPKKKKREKLTEGYSEIKVKKSGFLRTIFKYFKKYP